MAAPIAMPAIAPLGKLCPDNVDVWAGDGEVGVLEDLVVVVDEDEEEDGRGIYL